MVINGAAVNPSTNNIQGKIMPFITLTGADNSTPQDAFWALAKASTFGEENLSDIEWGILYSVSNQGTGRYPSFKWIERLAERIKVKPAGPSFALHVCGRAVGDFLYGRGHVTEVARAFNRIQINFRSQEFSLAEIEACIRRNASKTIITQHNEANRRLWQHMAHLDNHAVLFDESGGRGKAPMNRGPHLELVSCGYAGGLGPDNLAAELRRIQMASGGLPYWVDMEGKLRNEQDQFDVERAAQCLDIAGRFFLDHVADEARQ